MRTSFLKTVRKHYEYKFVDGKVLVRNKTTGTIMEYANIHEYVHSLSYVDMCIPASVSRLWNKKKEIIRTTRAVRNETEWNALA